MGFLGGLLGPILGGVLGGGQPAAGELGNTAADPMAAAEQERFQGEQGDLQVEDLQASAANAKRSHHFHQEMEVMTEDASESNLIQNYLITIEDADKQNIEKLENQITSHGS